MSIYFFTGNPGSGKTYHIVKEAIIPALHSKRKIYHNLPLNVGYLESLELAVEHSNIYLYELYDDQILKMYDHVESGALLIIDEVQNYFPAQKPLKDLKMIEFLTKHRHNFLDIIFATQNLDNLNKYFKNMCEVEWRFESQKAKGLLGRYMVKQFLRCQKKPFSKSYSKYDPRYFDLYKSYSDDAKAKGFKEGMPVKTSKALRNYTLIFVCLLFLTFFLASKLLSIFDDESYKSDITKKIDAVKKTVVIPKAKKEVVVNPKKEKVNGLIRLKFTDYKIYDDKIEKVIRNREPFVIYEKG